MALTAILTSFLITLQTITSTTNITNSTNKNNLSILTTSNSELSNSNFGVYRQTAVGLSEILIHTLVIDAISIESYHTALFTELFFKQILYLSYPPTVSFSNFMTTVVSYFGLTRDSIRRRQKSLLSLFSSFFQLRICRVSALSISPKTY